MSKRSGPRTRAQVFANLGALQDAVTGVPADHLLIPVAVRGNGPDNVYEGRELVSWIRRQEAAGQRPSLPYTQKIVPDLRRDKLVVLQDGDSDGACHRALAGEFILRDYGFSPAFKYDYPTRSVPLLPIRPEPPQPQPQPQPLPRYQKPSMRVLLPVPLAPGSEDIVRAYYQQRYPGHPIIFQYPADSYAPKLKKNSPSSDAAVLPWPPVFPP